MGMEQQVQDADKKLSTTPGDQLDPQMRNDLAQLHGNANKLLATRIDAILTSARLARPRKIIAACARAIR